MITLIIPTDFSSASLGAVKGFLNRTQGKKYNLVFVQRIGLSSSIQDLLFFNWKHVRNNLVPERFYTELMQLSVDYCEQVEWVDIAFFNGIFQRSFNRWVNSFENAQLFVNESFPFQFKHPMSLDIMPFVLNYTGNKIKETAQVNSYAFVPSR